MNTLEPRMPELALLRELPPEVSLAQVEQWVALFPPAPPPKPWYRNINLNTIIMTTASTLLFGGLLYFLSADPATPPPASQAAPQPAPAIETAPAPSAAIEPAASLAPATTPPARVSPAPSADPAPDAPIAAVAPDPPASTPLQVPGPSAGPSPAHTATPSPAPTRSMAAAPTSTSETERRFDLAGFEQVALLGSLDLELHQGPFSVVAIGPTDELEYVEATVKGGTLTIRQKDHREVQAEGHPKRRTKVYLGPLVVASLPGGSVSATKLVVHMPDLTTFDLEGSGSAMMHGFNGQESVAIRLSGSGDIELQELKEVGELRLEIQGSGNIRCTDAAVKGTTTLRLAGSGDMEVSGRTAELDMVLMGSGNVRAGAFAAERGSAQVIGSGDAEVNYTSDQVETKVMGSGDLKRVKR
jgi:hypothetical protein